MTIQDLVNEWADFREVSKDNKVFIFQLPGHFTITERQRKAMESSSTEINVEYDRRPLYGTGPNPIGHQTLGIKVRFLIR